MITEKIEVFNEIESESSKYIHPNFVQTDNFPIVNVSNFVEQNNLPKNNDIFSKNYNPLSI